jgi:antitoxin component YwqK of YwqJK toxin-antitoxin module
MSQNIIDYYANGQVKYLGYLHEGVKHGKWTEWNGDGDTVSIVNYYYGIKHGPFKIWRLDLPDENENESDDYAIEMGTVLKFIGTYNTDIIDGRYEVYFPSEQLKTAGYYKHGKMDGTWIQCEVNGDTTSQIKYKGGKKQGPFTIWDFYTNDPLAINSKSVAKLKHQGIYKDDKFHGNYVVWYPNGSVRSTGAYIDGRRMGEWSWYYKSGSIKEVVQFVKDKAVKTEKFDKLGKLIE